MTDPNTPPDTPTLYRPPGLERLYEMIDSCERHAVEVARDFADDPDFSKLARGVNALVQMQALIAKRHEQADADARRVADGTHTNIHTMKPFDAESLAKLHGDARAQRALEGANDNGAEGGGLALDSEAAERGCGIGKGAGQEPVLDFEAAKRAVRGERGATESASPASEPGPRPGLSPSLHHRSQPFEAPGQARGNGKVSPILPALRSPIDD